MPNVRSKAHQAVDAALARGDPTLDLELLAKLRGRYEGRRLRDLAQPAPGLARRQPPRLSLGCWLRDYKEQVWLFTCEFAIDWTDNCSCERSRNSPYPPVSGQAGTSPGRRLRQRRATGGSFLAPPSGAGLLP
jgi:hypothetical protein